MDDVPGDFLRLYTSHINDSKCLYVRNALGNINPLTTEKADDKKFRLKFSKNVKSKLYHIENAMTRGQTV